MNAETNRTIWAFRGMCRTEAGSPSGLAGEETILLVDDEASILKVGKISMTEKGYTVLTAQNGIEALRLFEKRSDQIDLLVLDVLMPLMNGWECLERLKQIQPEVCVIMTSGYPELDDETSTTVAAARSFLRKPYDTNTLMVEIRSVLDGE